MNTPTIATVKIEYYKTNIGVFVRNPNNTYYMSNPQYKVNGKDFVLTMDNKHFLFEGVGEITSVQKFIAARRVQKGVQVKEDVPESLKKALTSFYTLAEIDEILDDDDEECYGNKEYAAVSSMYEPVYETTEATWVDTPFELVLLGEFTIQNWQSPEGMVVKYQEGGFGGTKLSADLASIVCYDDIEKMLTPEFLLYTRPCSLSSSQVYKIIRSHVKENIDPRVAEITSDYDFCFTVKRKVAIKPVVVSQEIKKPNGRSYATPRFRTHTTTFKSVDLFEMTDSEHRYKGYTIVAGRQADNLVDMQKQIKCYLDALMNEINKEYVECECCGGLGTVVKKISTNSQEVNW